MASHTFLSVSGHIGDGALSAGPFLAQMVQQGHRAVVLDLTPGERGHPRLTPAEYRLQKLDEARSFADAIGATSVVFDDQTDGFLEDSDEIAGRVARLIRELKPDVMVTHWVNSIHTDHMNASNIAMRARFLAGLPGGLEKLQGVSDAELPRHGVAEVFYAENWEDMDGFVADTYVPIGEAAFESWLSGISTHAFARGETYGFRYIDYYTALMGVRGALAGGAGFPRAIAMAQEAGRSRVVTDF